MTRQNDLLDEALEKGILTEQQRAQIAALAKADAADNDERIKPVGTMNEIFVTVGVMLAMNASYGLLTFVFKQPLLTGIASTVLAWMVALYFHERKRFRLPIIYACISAATALAVAVGVQLYDGHGRHPNSLEIWPLGVALITLIAGAIRFRVPFLMLPIGIAFTMLVTKAAMAADSDLSYRLLLGISGLSILVMAVRFDLRDPLRVTRSSDYAFWSYVVGSPLFVHSLFLSILITDKASIHALAEGSIGLTNMCVLALLVVVVSFVGLLINRRALILSTLIYTGYVIFRILNIIPGSDMVMLLVTVLLIGFYVVCLGSAWTRVRRWVMSRLTPRPWFRLLPPF